MERPAVTVHIPVMAVIRRQSPQLSPFPEKSVPFPHVISQKIQPFAGMVIDFHTGDSRKIDDFLPFQGVPVWMVQHQNVILRMLFQKFHAFLRRPDLKRLILRKIIIAVSAEYIDMHALFRRFLIAQARFKARNHHKAALFIKLRIRRKNIMIGQAQELISPLPVFMNHPLRRQLAVGIGGMCMQISFQPDSFLNKCCKLHSCLRVEKKLRPVFSGPELFRFSYCMFASYHAARSSRTSCR